MARTSGRASRITSSRVARRAACRPGSPSANIPVARSVKGTASAVGTQTSELDNEGYLTITGRKKGLLITEGGKCVAPMKLWREAVMRDFARGRWRGCTNGEGVGWVCRPAPALWILPTVFKLG
ncbi:hypothetical protein AB0L75_24320 [Streptomyces sp. NPDC052101]|uniref:hypothetical protein n=1 Tax=Streptomyces sp. NPDC052101 TaxID=3155763 RepID=UPI0034132203